MWNTARNTALLAIALSATTTAHAADPNYLTGDTKLACEATLCLASGTQPSECDESLKRYFSIKHKKLKDTVKARTNFLKLCPKS
jgi:hypothetical protein